MQQATANSAQTPGLDDYDPFNKQKTTTAPAPAAAPPSQPAVMSPTQEAAPPQYTPTAQQTVTSADFQVGKVLLMQNYCHVSYICFSLHMLGPTGKPALLLSGLVLLEEPSKKKFQNLNIISKLGLPTLR